MTVQVKINERGALLNGRFAFTNKLTLVSELLQNARRAGATQVIIHHDAEAKRLTVIDDGCGIDDFQRLLTLNESGWDERTAKAEHAFGLGFSKCLYAAGRVTVTSRGRRLSFECDKALQQVPMDVDSATDADPLITAIELDDVDLPRLDQMIDRITRGFPIPVVYNNVPQARRHALASRPFTVTEIGSIHLSGTDTGEPATATAVYLQGLPIGHGEQNYYCDHHNVDVIHLDSSRFTARMPDRSELIDAQEQAKTIQEAVRQLWRAVLENRKRTMLPAQFVECFYAVARRQKLLRVFDDVPVIPRQACALVVAYPNRTDESSVYLQSPDRHPTRDDIESGTIRTARFDRYRRDEAHATLLYARAVGLILVNPYLLEPSHWAMQNIRDLDSEGFTVAVSGVGNAEYFDGLYVCERVKLCDQIEIRQGTHRVILRDDALFHDGVILYPNGCRNGDVVKQVSAYRDENEHFDETACQDDIHQLERMVRTLRCPDAASMLCCLLQELPLREYASLAGRTFRVSLGKSADDTSVELVS